MVVAERSGAARRGSGGADYQADQLGSRHGVLEPAAPLIPPPLIGTDLSLKR